MNDRKLVGTIEEAAQVLGVGRNKAYAMARNGELPVLETGKLKKVLWIPFMQMLHGTAKSEAA